MKQRVLMMAMGLLAAGSMASAEETFSEGFFSTVPSASGDYCRDEALVALHDLYGEEAKIEVVAFVDGAHETVNYWMKTNICEGYIVASFVRSAACKSAHYGSVPNYMKRLWAFGGNCVQVLPSDEFPQS